MTRFILYLDESGRFKDKGASADTSLVGGYYCPAPGLDEGAARALLRDIYQRHGLPEARTYHATDTADRVSRKVMAALLRDVLQGVCADPIRGQLVVMRNRGRGSILHNHLTYLHLAAECIVSVLRALHRKHGTDFALEVVLATRLILPDSAAPTTIPDPATPKTAPKDYMPRIREHLALTAYRLAQPDLVKVLPHVEVASGRTHPNLMVADHVCFAVRFDAAAEGEPDFRQEIDRHLLDEVVIEAGESASLRRSVLEGRFGDAALEAVALVSLPKHPLAGEARRTLFQDIVRGLRALPSQRRAHEFRRLFDSIDIRANLHWEVARGDELLSLLDQHVIQPLRDVLRDGEAWIDFRFHQLSFRVANHRGATDDARRHRKRALALAPAVISHWEMVPLWVDLQLDEAVFQTDACAHAEAVRILNGLEGTLGSIIRMLAEELKARTVHADVLGRIHGTRLQAHLLAGRRKSTHYEHARSDSEAAMGLFVGRQDLDRQYLYRCHLETDNRQFLKALGWLVRALGPHDAESSPADVGGRVAAIATALRSGPAQPFHLRHYCRLWAAAAAAAPAGDLATRMAKAWSQSGIAATAQAPEGNAYVHPWEVIDWKAGVALRRTGDPEAHERLDRATAHCLDIRTRPLRPPIYAIGLGCLAEWAALEHGRPTFGELIKTLRDRVGTMLDDRSGRFPVSMQAYFGPWREALEGVPTPDALLKLAHDVAY